MRYRYGYPIEPGQSITTEVEADNIIRAREQAVENFRVHCRMAKMSYLERRVFFVAYVTEGGDVKASKNTPATGHHG